MRERVVLDGQCLTALPDEVLHNNNLREMRVLYVHDNRLEQLPNSIAKLHRLTYLNAGGNKLMLLPPLDGLHELMELKLEGNPMLVLPDWIGDLPNLRELHLRNTEIDTLP